MGDDGDCMLNVFTSSTAKERNEEKKKRKAIALSFNPDKNKNNRTDNRFKSSSNSTSCGPPPGKKIKKQQQRKSEDGNGPNENPIGKKENDDGGLENERAESGVGKKSSSKTANKERGGAGHVLTKDRPFISNLFTKNPEAPSLAATEDAAGGETSKECVFSSSDVDGDQFKFHTRINSILRGQSDAAHFGIKTYTQVQLSAIPKILEGRDTLIKSQTGSGKTLAYALPIIHSLMTRDPKVDRADGTYAIVIVPTRELVLQGLETFNKLCAGCTWIVPGQLMGGEKKKSEKARLRKGVNILIATPGRLLDHLNTTEIFQKQLPSLDFLVFDEADRLMDLGFEKDLNEILAKIVEFRGPKKRTLQSILASATLNDDVSRLVRLSLYDPVTVDTAKLATDKNQTGISAMTTPSTLRHHFLVCPHKLRLVALASLILEKCRFSSDSSPAKLIVFVATLKCVDFFLRLFNAVFNATEMTDADHDAARATGVKWPTVIGKATDESSADVEISQRPIAFFGLHGEMPQEERTKTFRQFKACGKSVTESPTTGLSSVLFCTDVGARGLDVADVAWIVQFHPPGPPEDYVHRVGRCARAGTEGNAILFLTPTETEYVAFLREKTDIPKVREIPLLKVLTDGLLPGAERYLESGKKEKTIKMEDAATCVQLKMENYVALSATATGAADASSTTTSTSQSSEGVEKNNNEEKSTDVSRDSPSTASLSTLSKAAYFSFIRSYATYPKELKKIGFNVPSLHLGHVAKSFALREPPSKMKDAQGNVKQEKKRKNKDGGKKSKDGGKKKDKLKQLSEFSSGK